MPVINREWIQQLYRDKRQRGDSTEAVTDAILRRMPDDVNFIVPQFEHTRVNFQRVPMAGTSNPFIARDIPVRRQEHRRGPLRESRGHRVLVPAEHAARLIHVARQHDRRARRQDWKWRCS